MTQQQNAWDEHVSDNDLLFIVFALRQLRRFNPKFRTHANRGRGSLPSYLLGQLQAALHDPTLWRKVPMRFGMEKGVLPALRKTFINANASMLQSLANAGDEPGMQAGFAKHAAKAWYTVRDRLTGACGREKLLAEIRGILAVYRLPETKTAEENGATQAVETIDDLPAFVEESRSAAATPFRDEDLAQTAP